MVASSRRCNTPVCWHRLSAPLLNLDHACKCFEREQYVRPLYFPFVLIRTVHRSATKEKRHKGSFISQYSLVAKKKPWKVPNIFRLDNHGHC